MKGVAKVPGVRVQFDTDVERSINLFYCGKGVKIKECADGIYFFDTEGHEGVEHKNNKKSEILCYSALQTTRENKLKYTKKEIVLANKASHYQALLVWPALKRYVRIISQNQINNCDINVDDVMRAEDIWGTPPQY